MLVVHIGLLFLLCSLNGANDSLEYQNNEENRINHINDKEYDTDEESDTDVITSDSDEKDVITWEEYIESLLNITKLQFKKMKINLRSNYKLSQSEIKAMDKELNETGEHEMLLQDNLKKIIKQNKFKATYDFMIEFMDLSNLIFEKILDMRLDKIGGRLKVPMKWYVKTLKEKILRQETKSAVYNIESYMCDVHILCKDNLIYSDYVQEWAGLLLNVHPKKLIQFFSELPNVLSKHKLALKTNSDFLRKLKIILVHEIILRDLVDYVTEIITNKDYLLNLCPDDLKKSAGLLNQLFQEINLAYDMNETNAEDLDEVTDMIQQWKDGRDVTTKLFDTVIENMNSNVKGWPQKVKNKIDGIWFEIINL